MKKWEDWCRLCAKNNYNSEYNIYLNSRKIPQLSHTIQKHFQILIESNDGRPSKLCDICFQFINMIRIFNERCIRTESMYTAILCNEYGPNNSTKVRNKYIDDDNFNILNHINTDFNLDFIKEENIEPSVIVNENDLKLEESDDERNFDNYDNEETSDEGNDLKIKQTGIKCKLEIESNINSNDAQHTKKKERKKINYDGIFKCAECGQDFTKSYSYRTHMKSKHSEASFFCSQCPKSFTTGYLLKLHEKIHLPDELKLIHPCPECNKKFSKAANLRAHIRTVHYNERAFVCDECGKGFKLKCALQEHQYTHTEERPFQCTECPKKFKSLARLKVHNDQHTDTTYPCPKCTNICRTRKLLQAHMDVHKEEKSHKCDYCGNEYKRYKALKRHLVSSHTGFQIACEYCEKTFASSANCRKHQKSAHPEYLTTQHAMPIK